MPFRVRQLKVSLGAQNCRIARITWQICLPRACWPCKVTAFHSRALPVFITYVGGSTWMSSETIPVTEYPDRIGFKPDNPYLESFEPYIPAGVRLRELTPIPLIMGTVLGIIFGASSLYLVLKVGLTVSASIPVAVISITLFRLFSTMGGRDATILENNIVQTAGASEESRAAASPAAKREQEALGGATTSAMTIFTGFGVGLIYKALNVAFKGWKDVPERVFGSPFEAGSISAEISPELLGVGYIIGPRIASTMCAGGVLAYLVLIPAIKFFASGMTTPLAPGTVPISEMG